MAEKREVLAVQWGCSIRSVRGWYRRRGGNLGAQRYGALTAGDVDGALAVACARPLAAAVQGGPVPACLDVIPVARVVLEVVNVSLEVLGVAADKIGRHLRAGEVQT